IRNLHLRLQVTLGMDRAVKHGSCQSYFYHFSTFLKSELIRDQTSGIQSNDSCMNSVAKRKLVEPSGIEPLTSCVQGRRSEEHTSELQSREKLVCRLLLEKKQKQHASTNYSGRDITWSYTH